MASIKPANMLIGAIVIFAFGFIFWPGVYRYARYTTKAGYIGLGRQI